MTLHPNRPGGLRGPEGSHLGHVVTGLSLLLAAIEDLTAAVNASANQTAEMVNAIGTPADTDCGNTLLTSMCSILALLGEDANAEGGAPPFTCPGFAAPTSWLYANRWYLPETELTGPTGNAAPNWQTISALPTVIWEEYAPAEGDSLYVLPRLITPLNLTNICVAWRKTDATYAFQASWFNLSDDSFITSTTFGQEAEALGGSHSINFDADEYIVIQAVRAGGTIDVAPDGEIWISQGAEG